MKDFSRIRKHPWIWAAALAALLLLAWRAVVRGQADAAGNASGAATSTAIAVDTAAGTHADVPIYLSGLGTVQAFYTVTVAAGVEGELQKVAFTEGQTVHKGDLLAEIDPRPNQAAYAQAIATKARDAAQLANAKRDLERYTILQPQDLASKQTVDTQRSLVDQLAAQIQVDQAVIDNARTQLDYTRITSPIDGRTGIRLVDPGNIVHAAATTGTAKLKATFSNAHNTLWPGQYVNARVLVRTERNALTLPTAAVQLGPNGPFTYVVKPDSTVEVRQLKIGEESDGMTIVNTGLALNERVVTSNQYRLQAGAHLRVRATVSSAPTQAGGQTSSESLNPMYIRRCAPPLLWV